MTKERCLGLCIAGLIRAVTRSLRFRIDDRCGLGAGRVAEPVIWAFWHNRMLVMPAFARRYVPGRRGSVLTSPSRDGALIAEVMRAFGQGSIRGSSSRRGATALRELVAVMRDGGDVAITPDGPRGPRYRLQPGIILLAQQTGAPIMPVAVEYSGCWRVGHWDGFMIPCPLTRVEVTIGDLHRVRATADPEAFEAERQNLERLMTAPLRVH